MTHIPPDCTEGDPALDRPQYDRAEVLAILGISDGQLKGILDRKLVVLSTEHNPGTGNRRLYTGGDILRIAGALAGSSIGVPMRYASAFSQIIYDSACSRLNYGSAPGQGIALYPSGDDWKLVAFSDASPLDKTKLPPAYSVIDVGRLLSSLIEKLDTSFTREDARKWRAPEPAMVGVPDPFRVGRGRTTSPDDPQVKQKRKKR